MIQRCDCENMHLCVLSENKHFSSLQDQYILKHLFFLSRTHAVIFFQSIRWIMLYYRCVGSVFFSGFLRTFTPLKTLTSSVASYCRKSYSYIYSQMKNNDGKSEDNAKLKNLKNWGISKMKKNSNWRFSTLVGGVTHRIRKLISDTAYNCRRALRINFFINFFTLRGLVFIDWRKTLLRVLHI